VVGLAGKALLDVFQELWSTRFGITRGFPQPPRVHVHQGFGEERPRVGVLGILLHQCSHCIAVARRQPIEIGVRRAAVTGTERGNVVSFASGSLLVCEKGGTGQGIRRRMSLCGRGLFIDVRPHAQPDTPPRHGESGI